jgi:para-nitrobenzyl esterase
MNLFAGRTMKLHRLLVFSLSLLLALVAVGAPAQDSHRVQATTASGVVEGAVSADGQVHYFLGIPYARPPVGPLRWKPPQPPLPWYNVRPALSFAPRAMQGHIYDDMVFRDKGPSEDCLYLNVWAPANPSTAKLPVMVWIHGGGYIAGGTSEPRQDGTNLCKLGVIVVSMNYRMGVFGFFALPELIKESPQKAAGNYGLLDQVAALQWVKQNIAAFGGDPDNVTIFGESAGSYSVCALMASPLSQGLFNRAIGESGALFSKIHPTLTTVELERKCLKFGITNFGTATVSRLRDLPAERLLRAATNATQDYFRPNIDGYFLPASADDIFAAGRQSHVPLLAGWNRDEGDFKAFYTNEPPTPGKLMTPPKSPTVADYVACARDRFGDRADAFLKAYPAATDAEARRAAADYAGDRFIAWGTWKWLDYHLQTGESPVYRYKFEQLLPLAKDAKPGSQPSTPHAADIEFIFRTLPTRPVPWRPDAKKVSELMSQYWVNFATTGDPNGPGLPKWPQYKADDGYQVMHISTNSAAAPDKQRARYEFLNQQPLPW